MQTVTESSFHHLGVRTDKRGGGGGGGEGGKSLEHFFLVCRDEFILWIKGYVVQSAVS